jgi:preprotein translocase subunit SecE
MAKQATVTESQPGIVQRVVTFYEEVRTEMDKVTWPTMDDLKVSTQVTLLLLAFMATIIFFADRIFQFVMLFLLKLGA